MNGERKKFCINYMGDTLVLRRMVSIAVAGMIILVLLAACSKGVGETQTAVDTSTSTPPTVVITKNVITITPTVPATAIEINVPVEMSKFYMVTFSRSYEADVDGIKIPITIGLTKSLTERPVWSVKSFKPITSEVIDGIGKIYLYSCFLNYVKENSGNSDLTFEHYKEKVRQGEGEIVIGGVDEQKANTNKEREILKIKPSNGINLILTDSQLPVTISQGAYAYIAKGINGELIIIENSLRYSELKEIVGNNPGPQSDEEIAGIIFYTKVTGLLRFLPFTDNKCLLNDIYSLYDGCTNKSVSDEYRKIKKELYSGPRFLVELGSR